MTPTLTAVLCFSPGSPAETRLFGRPLWHWTLETVRSVRPGRVLAVSNGKAIRAEGLETISRRRLHDELDRLTGKVLLLPAELPCIRPGTLKKLLAASKSHARRLSGHGDGAPTGTAICAEWRELKPALSRAGQFGLDSLVRALEPLPLAPPRPEELLEVRTLRDLSTAARILRSQKSEKLLAAGVLIEDPATVHIDPDVRVGRGTRIRGWVVIESNSRIGTDCEIGIFTHIVDSAIGAGTIVLDHCFIRSSRIGKRAQIGPFAHLRPESVVAAEAKVGNFVELKKTLLGRGSKAPHLTYLGDARIGRGVNVGAGTITCNYDGEAKYQTVIGDGAFIGSDVQLVAPVRVGREAYVAAGSCIVEDVPSKSLALARSRQVNKPGWTRRKTSRKRRRG